MSRRLVWYKSGVVAPDGYEEEISEYVDFCDACNRQTDDLIDVNGLEICPSCLESDEPTTWFERVREYACRLRYGLRYEVRSWICKRCICGKRVWLSSGWRKHQKCIDEELPF